MLMIMLVDMMWHVDDEVSARNNFCLFLNVLIIFIYILKSLNYILSLKKHVKVII